VFQITGVVVLPGIELPSSARAPFLTRPFGQELEICKRYYHKSYNYATIYGTVTTVGVMPLYLTGVANATNSAGSFVRFGQHMRAPPTVTAYSPQTGVSGKLWDSGSGADVTPTLYDIGEGGFSWLATVAAAQPQFNLKMHWTADARL
jgi:hypothetical protein